jgi:hypothetical protein
MIKTDAGGNSVQLLYNWRKLYSVSSCISFNYTTGGSCTEFPPASVLIIQLEEIGQSFLLQLYN